MLSSLQAAPVLHSLHAWREAILRGVLFAMLGLGAIALASNAADLALPGWEYAAIASG